MTHFRVYWLTCISMIFAAAVSATTIVMPTDEQLVSKSPVIVRGTVVRSAAADRNGAIWTETLLAVDQALKGDVSGTITIREIGGQLADRITKIYGSPNYSAGEQVLVFLAPTPRGDFQTVDLFVGKFSAGRSLDGRQLWLRGLDTKDVDVLNGDFRPIEFRAVQRDAKGFETYVRQRASGRAADIDYEVANPVLEQSAPASSGGLKPSADFTLISEPTVYRWFTFDNGGSAQWLSYGSQTGYSGGGVNEIQTAMAAWNNYSAANIRYAYSGSFSSGAVGLSRPNGVNEVLFNDPNAEIAGSFNPSTGGVVGIGGFNGVSGTRSWTAPFTADASHPQQTYGAWNIVEGNLTIQDGVTAAGGISSAVLAEIVAHEFGHTLGFGHSPDSTALMYASVTRLGASLRADDQLAARWLYPSGSGSTPPPPPAVTVPVAPSNLTGSVSGNSVNLSWSDNATNETSQAIYYAPSGQSYFKAGDVAAGATSAAVNGFSAGTYRLYVTASNSAGESAASNVITVTIGTPFTASFRVSPGNSGLAGTTFTFIDDTAGVVSRTWNFGDGSFANAQTVSHAYAAAGSYTVTLTVSNGSVQTQVSQVISVTAVQPALTPAFTWSPSNPVAGTSVAFRDQSGGGPTAWNWSFGDGTGSTLQNPTKQYGAPGGYVVTLTVTRPGESRATQQTITVASQSPVTPPADVFRTLIPVTAQTTGVAGSRWRTELTLFNAGTEGVTVDLLFVPGSGGGLQTRSLFLSPKQSRTYANALLDIYGIGSGSGAIAIEARSSASTPRMKVNSRTFNDTGAGTYGQAVPAVNSDGLDQTQYVTGMQATADYRTNIGFVNRSSSAVTASLTLYQGDGNVAANGSITLAGNSFQQGALTTYFPTVANRTFPALTMRVSAPTAGAVSAYASVIDNRSQDPVYIQAVRAPAARSLTIPVVGRAPGANGTFWRSDVTLFNPNGGWLSVGVQYGSTRKTLVLTARETNVLADIVSQMGQQNGNGTLQLSWDGGTGPVVTSRTYTNAANGTYGQSIDPISGFGSEQFVTGLRSDLSFRSNIGFVNGGNAPVNVRATILSASGFAIATNDLTVQPNAQVQTSVAALFPNVNAQSVGSFTLQATADAPTLFAYGSIVDNATGDPVFFEGR